MYNILYNFKYNEEAYKMLNKIELEINKNENDSVYIILQKYLIQIDF